MFDKLTVSSFFLKLRPLDYKTRGVYIESFGGCQDRCHLNHSLRPLHNYLKIVFQSLFFTFYTYKKAFILT